MILEPMKDQHRPKGRGNLLLNPVTVVGVLGLWSFIAGGTVRGAGHGHTSTPTPNTCHTRTGFRERI